MGLNATLKAAAKTAMRATGDLAVKVTYKKRVAGAYDPILDVKADTFTDYANVSALLCRFNEDDADWYPANATSQKILIAYNDLPIIADDADLVVIDGVTWNIHKRRGVPGDSLHILFVRLP